MDNTLEEKLGAILSNPEMMRSIQAMAQSLGQSSSNPPQEQTKEPKNPALDPGMLQKLTAMAGQTGIDQNQKSLLTALSPYMNQAKVAKLENAMRAAKMARLASGFLGSGGLNLFSGR
jgi:hypothetical protein